MLDRKTEILKKRLASRGIPHSADPAFLRMIPWTRFTYATSGSLIAVATILGFTPTLWMNAILAALAVLMPHHILEYFYNYVLRRVTRTAPLPSNKAPTKFAFGLMSLWLVVTAIAFESGYTVIGTVMGAVIVFFAVLVCVSHICIPAAIYGLITGTKGAASSCTLPRPS